MHPSAVGVKVSVRLVCVFVAGVVIGAALMSLNAHVWTDFSSASGTILEHNIDALRSVTYTSAKGTTIAQRGRAEDPFELQITFADGRPVQRCRAGQALDGAIRALLRYDLKRRLSAEELKKSFPLPLGVVDIRDTLVVEPSGPVLLFANLELTSTAVVLDGLVAETSIHPSQFAQFQKSCEAADAALSPPTTLAGKSP